MTQHCPTETAKTEPPARDRALAEQLRLHIEAHAERRISLAELGKLVDLSPFTVQKLFQRQMGLSPLGYQRALKANRLRQALRQGASSTEAVYAAGFSSLSRAQEGATLGMKPSVFARGGEGEEIAWAAEESAYGWILVGETPRGLCWLSLAASKEEAFAQILEEFPRANLTENPEAAHWIAKAIGFVEGEMPLLADKELEEKMDLRGTEFQIRVWQALRKIPRGERLSYGKLAEKMGIPRSTRAVARACATNRVALLVPCHRIVGSNGSLTGYRWGIERKRKLLSAEGDLDLFQSDKKPSMK